MLLLLGVQQVWFNFGGTTDVAYTLVEEADQTAITTNDMNGTTVGLGMIYNQIRTLLV